MAERFLLLERLLTNSGYACSIAEHPNMPQFIVLNSKTDNIRFGLGALNGQIAIVRYSHLDGNDGSIAILSCLADVSLITFSIELLAKGAINALQSKGDVKVA
jgi:hypothetical protein